MMVVDSLYDKNKTAATKYKNQTHQNIGNQNYNKNLQRPNHINKLIEKFHEN